jgi:cyclic pyranopterin phosphate synthase
MPSVGLALLSVTDGHARDVVLMPRPHFRDQYGRLIAEVRISVTDRCNFLCVYCQPTPESTKEHRDQILSFEEIVRLVEILISRGVNKVRLTGGEPLVRKGIEKLAGMLAALPGLSDLALTTNGFRLSELAGPLAGAGLKRVNVSLDTLDRARFQQMTKSDSLGRVLEGMDVAERSGLQPLKVNCVVMRGVNDDEAVEFARFARRTGRQVRFIEYMPFAPGGTWDLAQVVPGAELRAVIAEQFPLVGVSAGPESTAERYRFADAPGEVGFITPVTRPFCGGCDRLRVTADGKIRNCLFAREEHDLKALLRSGAPKEAIEAEIEDAVWGKEKGTERLLDQAREMNISMASIGG